MGISETSKSMLREKMTSLIADRDALQEDINRLSLKLDSFKAKKTIILSRIQELRDDANA